MQGKFQKFFNTYVWNLTPEERASTVSIQNPHTPLNGTTLFEALGGEKTKSGRSISEAGVMSLSAVYRSVAIKAGFVASLPFKCYEKTEDGRIEVDDPISYLLSRRPNSKMSKAVFFDRAMQHYELKGNHFAEIIRNGIGMPVELILTDPDTVTVHENKESIAYELAEGNGQHRMVDPDNMIHVPNMGTGLVGKSVIRYMREDASMMMDIRDYGSGFFGRGGKPAGLLLPKMQVDATKRQETKQSFMEAKMQGGEVVLPYGWDYKEVSVPPSDAQWVASNDFTIATIARWFGVPTQKLGDSKVKYSNVEYMGIEFVQDTMQAICSKFESEYTNKLYALPSQKKRYCEFNMDAYLRGDSISKAETMAKQIQNAIKTPNEIRKLNNDKPIAGGDELFIQGATVPLSLQKELYASKQGNGGKAEPDDDEGDKKKEKVAKTVRSLRSKARKRLAAGDDPQLILEGILGNDGRSHE